MKIIKVALISIFLSTIVGCKTIECKPSVAHVLPGTNTAVVGISIDGKGYPQEPYRQIVVHPGQKILFAGPEDFSIIFKNKKTPNRKIDNPSENGVVVIKVPDAILESAEFMKEFRETSQIKFNYGIRVGDKELDPEIIIRRKN